MRSKFVFSTHTLARCLGNRCSIIATTSHDVFSPLVTRRTSSLLLQTRGIHVTDAYSIRTRHPDEKQGKQHSEEGQEEQKNEGDAGEQKKQQQEGAKKIDPGVIRKLRIYVLAVAGLSFVSSFFLLSQMFTGDRNLADGLANEDFTRPGIPMKTFVDKYLKHGEVKRIVFVPANTRAIALLHPGAVIDGRTVQEQSIVVEYQQNAQQFWADIRKAEAELGIGLSQGVQIDLYQGMTTLKLVELLIGVTILAWLGTQYGRLLRKRLLENRAKMEKQGK